MLKQVTRPAQKTVCELALRLAKRAAQKIVMTSMVFSAGVAGNDNVSNQPSLLPKSTLDTKPALNTNPAVNAKPSIVALSPHIVELLFEIGAGAQIIGTTEFADFPEQAKHIPVVGNYLGLKIETILALQPDLIIAWGGGNVGRDLEKLQKLGFDIIYSQPLNLPDVAKDLREFGKKTGNAALAEQKAAQFEQALASLEQQYRDTKPVRAFYEIWHTPLTTVAQNGWAHNLLGICNIQNVFAEITQPYPQVNIEQVISREVELIIQPQSEQSEAHAGYPWHNWPDIPAVKFQRILHPNADKLHRMTSRTLDELKALCSDVHASVKADAK